MPDHNTITDLATLENHYASPGRASLIKVTNYLTPAYATWIGCSRFCVLSTVGPHGTDGSPRGDDSPVAKMPDPQTLLMPDWRGNNRLDTLRNIVEDGRISCMFMVPVSDNVVRVNGHAKVSVAKDLIAQFVDNGRRPTSVIVIKIAEVYSQCARALMRSELWNGQDNSAGLPTVGQMLAEVEAGFDGDAYDADWPGRAAKTMW